jgi:hypothetical protein
MRLHAKNKTKRKRKAPTMTTKKVVMNTTKRVPMESVSTRFFAGDVEYCSLTEALLRSEARKLISEHFRSFAGTAIYAYLRTYRNKFSSYIETNSGRIMYPNDEVQERITEYLSTRPIKEKEVLKADPMPELAELLSKLKQNPELVKTILEIVA